jgi:acyl carrier protein
MSHKEEAPKSDAALVTWLLALLERTPDVYVRRPPNGIVDATTSLRDGLGIDSIGRLCVFYAVVDALKADDDEATVSTWTTVGDVLAFVRRKQT